jgi:DNA-binding winged helix-turn-helix (wHTH) protein
MGPNGPISFRCSGYNPEALIYQFSGYEVDTDRFQLRRDGVSQRLEPQVFEVLVYLIANRDRLVSKDELLEKVWGDKFVSEAALNSRLMAARRAIG